MLCHFSGKPSTTRLSVAKYLSPRSYKILHILLLTLAPSGVDRWFAALIESYD